MIFDLLPRARAREVFGDDVRLGRYAVRASA